MKVDVPVDSAWWVDGHGHIKLSFLSSWHQLQGLSYSRLFFHHREKNWDQKTQDFEKTQSNSSQKTQTVGGPMYCPWPKKLRLSEALFSVLCPKKLRIWKKLKTEHKKLSLSEGRAYKFLQKFGEKKAWNRSMFLYFQTLLIWTFFRLEGILFIQMFSP